MIMKRYQLLLWTIVICSMAFFQNCKNDNNSSPAPYSDLAHTYGFGLFDKINGIWAGPLTSTTVLGNFSEWVVDFRPISENQVSAKNELDSLNDIFMSFFVTKYNNQYRLGFRNGGSFNGMKRVSYFLCDSVSETSAQSFYRFSEIVIGKNRAYTDVLFSHDSLYISSYTNKYNTQLTSTLHMSWSARLQDRTSCAPSISTFSFPKKTLTIDFSTAFQGETESVYYSTNSVPANDPYPETVQPALGQTTINYSYAGIYTPDPSKKVLLVITTQPLFSGFTLNSAALLTRSRYVILAANDDAYTFNYMHPGNYYVYAIYDHDDNRIVNSGDWISASNTAFTLSNKGTVNASTQIVYTIP